MNDHVRHQDDVGAYLLGALNDLERQAFERHLRACAECQEELARLRPAADALPGSVQQFEPPARLKALLMEVVEGEARVEQPAPERRRPRLRFFMRPAFVAALIGLVVGFAVAQLGGGDEPRTLAATVDQTMPNAGGSLRVSNGDAKLRLHDMPRLGGTRVYQVWVQHGDHLVPARTFQVGADGRGAVDLSNVDDADGVYVTREPRGGAQVPSEDPIVSVPL
jgi:anti-sigma-K factor RskA